MKEEFLIPVIEGEPDPNGWATVKLSCLNQETDCDGILIMDVIFDPDTKKALVVKQESMQCPLCDFTIFINPKFRLQ